MVARIASGKSIRGVLVYNERKVERAEAQLLLAAGFPRGIASLSFMNKLERFEKLTRQNERTKTNTIHISLSFSRKDQLNDHLLREIAQDYMTAIGFGSQPFLVYRHFDTAHPHIHIASVNIDSDGQRIETHNIGKNQSQKARREIEDRYRLLKAEEQSREEKYLLRAVDPGVVRYGKSELKSAVSRTVREVVDYYQYTSFEELNAVLRQFNVTAYRGKPGGMMYEKEGLTYHVLDGKKKKIGIPIKASSIYGSPTLKNINKKYGRNKEERKPYAIRLKRLLDKAISTAKSPAELEAKLKENGIKVLLHCNENMVYGATFIDNDTRCVFKGSSLGKEFSAKSFLERTGIDPSWFRPETGGDVIMPEGTNVEPELGRQELTAIEFIWTKNVEQAETDAPEFQQANQKRKGLRNM